MTIRTLILILEFITVLIATITWKKYRFTGERNFVYFFWVVFIVDISGMLMNFYTLKNHFLYNFLYLVYFSFLLHWYYSILKNKKVVISLIIIYILTLVHTFYKQNFFTQNQTDGLVGGCVVLLFCSLIYFYQILQSDKILHVKNSLPFWLTIGNIIYFMGLLPIMLLQKYIGASDLIYGIVLSIVNFITYTCYTIGFLWAKKR